MRRELVSNIQSVFIERIRNFPKHHWFWILVTMVAAANYLFVCFAVGVLPVNLEYFVLADSVTVFPLAHFICYRKADSSRLEKIINAALTIAFAVWLASKTVPIDKQVFLAHIDWVRKIGVAFVYFLELRFLISLWQGIFQSGKSIDESIDDIERKKKIPFWAVKMMRLEAKMWGKLLPKRQ